MMQLETIIERVSAGQRIEDEDYLLLEKEADLHQLGFLANSIRQNKHPENIVTYVIDRNINYTDICISACKFCAFFKSPEDQKGYLISFEELADKIEKPRASAAPRFFCRVGFIQDNRWNTTRRWFAS